METTNQTKIYNSFEQFKSSFFPQLVKKENEKQEQKNIKNFAVFLANQSVDRLLNQNKNQTFDANV